MIHSYSSIYNMGHAAIADLLKGPVIVEEKVDGSQISFGVSETGELRVRSKGAQINTLAPEPLFCAAVESIKSIQSSLTPGTVYRGEYLSKPHHNALTYSRIPIKHIAIFDISPTLESYLPPEAKSAEAARVGLECVPVLFVGVVNDVAQFRSFLDRESFLGGQKIEGVVVKPLHYDLFGKDKKVLMGKFVSEAFKEVHEKTWDAEHKTKGPQEIIEALTSKYGTAARWGKALIHLKEQGQITNEPKDIAALLKEVPQDIEKECAEQIKSDLYAWAWPQLRRRVGHGLPEWYKDQLLKLQFTESN